MVILQNFLLSCSMFLVVAPRNKEGTRNWKKLKFKADFMMKETVCLGMNGRQLKNKHGFRVPKLTHSLKI